MRKNILGLSGGTFLMVMVALMMVWSFTHPLTAHHKEPPQNHYFREDQEKRERWRNEAQERKARGEPPLKENMYFKEDRERREAWAAQDREAKARGEPLGRENRYFKEDKLKRDQWKDPRKR